MQFAPPPRPRRKPSLTPMIDVVFLLLVFFMLASRFGVDAMLPMPLAASDGEYTGPPRLVDISADAVLVNGIPTDNPAAALAPLMESPSDMVVLRGRDGATLQHVVSVTEDLRAAGFTSVVLVE